MVRAQLIGPGNSINQPTQPVARGRPFPKGNGGRKPGSKNRTTLIATALLAGEEEELVR